jgi:hypothetical protein
MQEVEYSESLGEKMCRILWLVGSQSWLLPFMLWLMERQPLLLFMLHCFSVMLSLICVSGTIVHTAFFVFAFCLFCLSWFGTFCGFLKNC